MHISTYFATEEGKGYSEVHIDTKEELVYILQFNTEEKQINRKDFPNKSVSQVENIAEEWALGYKHDGLQQI
tara:strand:- start:342 stop:557 length:216 start_codon:yes stop_codon:yes gene_type:complete